MVTFSKGDNIIDSRDVISRIEELESEREALSDAVDSAREALEEHQSNEPDEDADEEVHEAYQEKLSELKEALVEAASDLDDWDEDDDQGGELKELRAFSEEGESATSDWPHGAMCILESYFEDYCQELLADIGDLPKDLPHYIVIDWTATAKNLEADYSSITWGGETYLVR